MRGKILAFIRDFSICLLYLSSRYNMCSLKASFTVINCDFYFLDQIQVYWARRRRTSEKPRRRNVLWSADTARAKLQKVTIRRTEICGTGRRTKSKIPLKRMTIFSNLTQTAKLEAFPVIFILVSMDFYVFPNITLWKNMRNDYKL